jgi:Mrp family chromosome partitioning ATPase
MTSLDQALLRAFGQPGGQPPAAPSSQSIPLSEALAGMPGGQIESDAPDHAAEEDAGAFRAMLQVDNVVWPKCCTHMPRSLKDELDQLAAGLLDGNGARRTVVGIAGASSGAGCTTLVLGVARRLARHGVNLLVMDANPANPAVTSRLGLLPEVGWDAVAAGRLSVAEALIESLGDKMTLLPLCDAGEVIRAAGPDASRTLARSVLETLRRQYEVVLVDLGVPTAGGDALGLLADWLDAAAVVRNVRSGSADELARAVQRLEAFGITVAGVAENFVPTEEVSAWRSAA